MSEMLQSLPLAAAVGPEDHFEPHVDATRGSDASRAKGSSASRHADRPGRLRSLGRLLRAERGTAVVEFALVVIPLTLIVFGIIDFGRALNYYNDLTQLAGQGARAAAVNENVDGTNTSGAGVFQQKLVAEADSPELKDPANQLKACVEYTSPLGAGQPVKVITSYQFHFIPLVHPVAITLHAEQTERYESSATPIYTADSPGTCP